MWHLSGLFAKQLSLFEDSIIKMIQDGVDTFVEIGPGKTLCGFIKKVSKDVTTLNVEDMESLDNTLSKLL